MTILEKRLHKLQRHIRYVQENALVLSEYFISIGQFDNAKDLIANSLVHDQSKFHGEEWANLHADVKEVNPKAFYKALEHHWRKNRHHPEHWPHISKMPQIYLAEFVCDIKARGNEFGTCTMDWLVESAAPKYNFSLHDPVFFEIKTYLEAVCEKAFV